MSETNSPTKGFKDGFVVQSERQRDAETKHLQRKLQAKKKSLGRAFQDSRHQSTSPVRHRKALDDSRDVRTQSEPRSPRASPHILPAFSNHSLIEKYLVECARTMNKKDFNEEEWKLANQIRNTTNAHPKRPFLKSSKNTTPKRSLSQPGSRVTTPERFSSTPRTIKASSEEHQSTESSSQLQHFQVPVSFDIANDSELTMNVAVSIQRGLTPPPTLHRHSNTPPPQFADDTVTTSKSRGLTPPRYIRSTAEQMSVVMRSEAYEEIPDRSTVIAKALHASRKATLHVESNPKAEEALAQRKLRAEEEAKRVEEALAQRKLRAEEEANRVDEALAQRKLQAEEEANRVEEALTQKRLRAEEEANRVDEALAQRKLRAEEEARQAEEDASVRKKEAFEVAKQAQEEASMRRARGDAAAKKAERETQAKKLKEEAALRIVEAELAHRKLEAEEAVKKAEEEAAARTLSAEVSVRCLEEEFAVRILQAERSAKKAEEESAARELRAEVESKRVEEDSMTRKVRAEALARLAEEQAAVKSYQVEEEFRKLEEYMVERQRRITAEANRVEEEALTRKRQVEEEVKRIEDEATSHKLQVQAEAMREEQDAAIRKLQAEHEAKKAEDDLTLRKLHAEQEAMKVEEECVIRKLHAETATRVAQEAEEARNNLKEEEEEAEVKEAIAHGEDCAQAARKLLADHEVTLEDMLDAPPSPPHRLLNAYHPDLTLGAVVDSQVLASKQVKKFIRKRHIKASTHKSPLKQVRTKHSPNTPNTPHTDKEEGDTDDSSWTLTGSSGRSRSRVRRPPSEQARDSSQSSQSLGGFEDLDASPIRSEPSEATIPYSISELQDFRRAAQVNAWSQSSVCSYDSSHSSTTPLVSREYFLGRWGYWLVLVFTAAALTFGSAFIGLSHLRNPRTVRPSTGTTPHLYSERVTPLKSPKQKMRWQPRVDDVRRDFRDGIGSKVRGEAGVGGGVLKQLRSASQHPLVVNSDIAREIVGVSMNSKLIKQLRRIRAPLRLCIRHVGKTLLLTKRWAAFILRPLSKARLLPLPFLLAFMFMSVI